MSKNAWYIGGLNFECSGCGNCCSGPDEGVIWINKQELRLLAEFLKMPLEDVLRKYTKRLGLKTTIIEHPITKDCVFLEKKNGQKRCTVYPVRPSQCRTWPFWTSNLSTPTDWNYAATRCPGINRGEKYSFEKIEKIRKNQT